MSMSKEDAVLYNFLLALSHLEFIGWVRHTIDDDIGMIIRYLDLNATGGDRGYTFQPTDYKRDWA